MGYYGNSPYGINPYNFSQNQLPQNNFQQPTQMPQLNTFQNNLIKVTGINGAKAYQMQPNGAIALFDDSNDVFFIKTTDGANFPTIRMFQFSEIKEEQSQQTEYVTRQEFNELKEMFDNGKQHISEQQSKSKQIKQSKQSSTDDTTI